MKTGIYYTTQEGGTLYRLEKGISDEDIIRELESNYRHDIETGLKYTKLTFHEMVHSVLWRNDGKIEKAWDSSFKGFRPLINTL